MGGTAASELKVAAVRAHSLRVRLPASQEAWPAVEIMVLAEGRRQVPQGPGLGVRLDPHAVARSRVWEGR